MEPQDRKLAKLMEQRERERPDEIGDIPVIHRQLGRIATSLEALEDVARWVVSDIQHSKHHFDRATAS